MLAYWLADLGQKNIIGLEKSSVIPSDIASTAHASDFVYNTTHDKLGCWTTEFSRKFYEDNGLYPMTVKIVGKGSLYDPKNEKVRT